MERQIENVKELFGSRGGRALVLPFGQEIGVRLMKEEKRGNREIPKNAVGDFKFRRNAQQKLI